MVRAVLSWWLAVVLGSSVAVVGAVAVAGSTTGPVLAAGAAAQDDDDDDDANGAGQLTLSGASHPAHIHDGTCPTLGDVVYPLNNVAPRGAGEDDDDTDDDSAYRGAEGAAAGLVSETEVEAALDDILAAPHAVNVHASEQDIGTYVACGELGGVVVDDELIVGLRPLNGSGLAGIAVLEDDDDGETEVTVYLAAVGEGGSAPSAAASAAPSAGGSAAPSAAASAAPSAAPSAGDDDDDGDD